MDLLSDSLLRLQPRDARYYPSALSAPWGFATPEGPASYHVVLEGQCWFDVDDHAPVQLHAGDVAITPTGRACRFRSGADVWAPPLASLMPYVADDGVLRPPGSGPTTHLICGTIDFDLAAPHPLLDALPARIVVRSAEEGTKPWLRQTLQAIAHESRLGEPGASAAMSYLACVLFVRVVRAYLQEADLQESDRRASGAPGPGLLRALQDSQIAPVLEAVHTRPDHDWTVASLAATAGLSRSAFAERFVEVMDVTPMVYVTRWRMREAARLLRMGEAPLDEIAERVGYGSAAALGRRFKQEVGKTPGTYRAQAA